MATGPPQGPPPGGMGGPPPGMCGPPTGGMAPPGGAPGMAPPGAHPPPSGAPPAPDLNQLRGEVRMLPYAAVHAMMILTGRWWGFVGKLVAPGERQVSAIICLIV